MRISILTPDMSHNCLGRAWLLAKILERRYAVDIVGPVFGNGIWPPLSDGSFQFSPINIHNTRNFFRKIPEYHQKITCDVIYASKPLMPSYGVSLLKKLATHLPLILDIDDWQLGFFEWRPQKFLWLRKIKQFITDIELPFGYTWTYFLEKLIFLSDEITVSNFFLQKKFGGIIIPHARDTSYLDPMKYNPVLLRKQFNISNNKKVITFLGSPRPYKGIEDLISAIKLLKRNDIILLLIGIGDDPYCNQLNEYAIEMLNKKVLIYGLISYQEIPKYLAITDLVVIPQRKCNPTCGQVPAKLFDAMAMGRPIIATTVSDFPEILKDCGWLVEPQNPNVLKDVIEHVLTHPEESAIMGMQAREKCVSMYSWDAIETKLVAIFEKYK